MTQAHSFARSSLRRLLVSAFALSSAWCTVTAFGSSTVTISGSPSHSATAGVAYSFTPTTNDTASRALVFSINRKPSWATFNTSTGRLSGTPSAANVGWYYAILIQVSDGLWIADLPGFSLHVVASQTSKAPIIYGTPATTAAAGQAYSFQPSASGPSGMTLSFSVQNMPPWATFSIASGRLSGMPSSTQTGTYGNIIVSVSDGQASSALAPFSISVTGAAATGQATVNWSPPTQNTNGTALTNLAGVRIYYGPSASSLSQLTQVAGTAVNSYTISNLSAGTWYFGALAYTTTGAQSSMSSIVSKTVP
jgi:Putative Ig domain